MASLRYDGRPEPPWVPRSSHARSLAPHYPPGTQIIVFIGLLETVYFDGLNYSGDYGTGYFGKFLPPDQKAKKLNIELNNGRAAMAGILGMMADEFITGQTLAERHLFPF